MIFDGVVSTPRKHFCHLGPLVSVCAMCQKQSPFLMIGPIDFEDTRIEVIMPTLTALFSKPARNVFSDHGPSLRAMFLY
jgi:hypothetical protein